LVMAAFDCPLLSVISSEMSHDMVFLFNHSIEVHYQREATLFD